MCRLFGFRSTVASRVHRSLVEAENAVAAQARQHRDGWGIAWFHRDDAYLIKSQNGAADCQSFRRASERLASNTLVVHVRRATVGAVDPFNIHPFRHGRWVFAHNGTIHGFERLAPALRAAIPEGLAQHILGTTDTETLFYWLLARLERAGVDPLGREAVHVSRLHGVLAEAWAALAEHARAHGAADPLVNFILTNGRSFVAQRAGRELWFATQKLACRDEARCTWPDKVCLLPERRGPTVNHLLVASERIGDEERWEEVPEQAQVHLSEDFRLSILPLPAA